MSSFDLYSHSSIESEFLLSSEGCSSGEKEICHNTGRDETKKKVKGMKIAISILSVLVVFFACLSIGLLATTYYSHRNHGSSSISEHSDITSGHNDGFVYPFIKSSKGEASLRGHVTLDEPITEPFDLYSGSNEDETFLVYESVEKDNNLYEVTSDSFCCSGRRDSESCGKKVNEDTVVIPARTAEEAQRIARKLLKDKEFGTKQERLCHNKNPLVSFIQSSSHVPQRYHCHFKCQPATMEHFLEHNPEMIQKMFDMFAKSDEIQRERGEDPTYTQADLPYAIWEIKQILDKLDTQCLEGNGDHAGTTKTEFYTLEEAEKSAWKDVGILCGGVEGKFQNDELGEKFSFGHICQPLSVECRPGPDCWFGIHTYPQTDGGNNQGAGGR